jgi:hypothetical protein
LVIEKNVSALNIQFVAASPVAPMPNASLVGRVNPEDFVVTTRNSQSYELKT